MLEQQALLALVGCDYAAAAETIAGLIAVLRRFPVLLRDFVPTVQMLQGGRVF